MPSLRIPSSFSLSYGIKIAFLISIISIISSSCTEKDLASPAYKKRLSYSVFSNTSGSLEEQAAAQRNAAQEGRTLRGIEEEILRIEKILPGFGGFFMDSTGNIVVHGPAGLSDDSIKSVINHYASNLRVRTQIREKFLSPNSIKVTTANFPFSHLVVWQIKIMQYLQSGSGLIGIDADERYNVLTIIIDSTSLSSEQTITNAAIAAGIPHEAIRIRKELSPSTANLTASYRPTAAGLQNYTSSSGICTLGFNTTKSSPAVRGFLAAGHCEPSPVGGTGLLDTAIGQPTLISGYKIGEIHTNPVWNRTDVSCAGITKCTIADVLFGEYDSNVTSSKSVVLTTSVGINGALGSRTVSTSKSISGVEYYPMVGDSVDKVGRTTGWTRGIINNSCINFVITGVADSAMHLCAMRANSSAVGQGDSGAPVFYEVDDNVYDAYGILFGRSSPTHTNDEGKSYCQGSQCYFIFTPYLNIVSHLGFTPIPY